MVRRIAAAGLLMFAIACSSANGSLQKIPGSTRNVIGFEEIESRGLVGGTAWDLINSLRPNFLNSRGPTSLQSAVQAYPVVYLDGTRYGDIQTLKTISADSIRMVEYMTAGDATTRFGTDHASGVILLVMR